MFAPLQEGLQDLFLFFKNAVCVSRNSVFNIPFVTVGHIHLPLVARSAPNFPRGCVLKRILRPLAESPLSGSAFLLFQAQHGVPRSAYTSPAHRSRALTCLWEPQIVFHLGNSTSNPRTLGCGGAWACPGVWECLHFQLPEFVRSFQKK